MRTKEDLTKEIIDVDELRALKRQNEARIIKNSRLPPDKQIAQDPVNKKEIDDYLEDYPKYEKMNSDAIERAITDLKTAAARAETKLHGGAPPVSTPQPAPLVREIHPPLSPTPPSSLPRARSDPPVNKIRLPDEKAAQNYLNLFVRQHSNTEMRTIHLNAFEDDVSKVNIIKTLMQFQKFMSDPINGRSHEPINLKIEGKGAKRLLNEANNALALEAKLNQPEAKLPSGNTLASAMTQASIPVASTYHPPARTVTEALNYVRDIANQGIIDIDLFIDDDSKKNVIKAFKEYASQNSQTPDKIPKLVGTHLVDLATELYGQVRVAPSPVVEVKAAIARTIEFRNAIFESKSPDVDRMVKPANLTEAQFDKIKTRIVILQQGLQEGYEKSQNKIDAGGMKLQTEIRGLAYLIEKVQHDSLDVAIKKTEAQYPQMQAGFSTATVTLLENLKSEAALDTEPSPTSPRSLN